MISVHPLATMESAPAADSASGPTHHTHIVDSIRQMISDGVLKPGDPLPSERELAERFGVSRVPVREAVKILEFIGVLRRVRSRGLFVNRLELGQAMNQFNFLFVNTPEAVNELFEVRTALEVQSAVTAAQRRSERDLIAIEDEFLATERAITLGRDAATPAIRFHHAIAKAAHNSVLLRIFDFMFDLQVLYVRSSMKTTARQQAVQHDHRLLLELIRTQDAATVATVMKDHMATAAQKAHEAVLLEQGLRDGELLSSV